MPMICGHHPSIHIFKEVYIVKPVLSGHSKRTPKIGFQYQLLLNADQKYCRMLQGEHSAILSTFIKLPFSIKTFVLSIFKWPLKTGFTVSVKPVGYAYSINTYSFIAISIGIHVSDGIGVGVAFS